MLTQKQATAEVKLITPFIGMMADLKGLNWDFGYLLQEDKWEATFFTDEGKTIEYYKEPTTYKLAEKILNKTI